MLSLEFSTEKIKELKDVQFIQSVTISKREYEELLKYKEQYVVIKDFLADKMLL